MTMKDIKDSIDKLNENHNLVMERLLSQDTIIKSNMKSIDSIADTLKAIEKDVRPIRELMGDVATVGRIGRYLGRWIIWIASIIAAITALWLIFTNKLK